MRQAFILLITSLLVITPSVYQESINNNDTTSIMGITENGDVFITVRGIKYISEMTDEELKFKRINRGLESDFSEPDTGWVE